MDSEDFMYHDVLSHSVDRGGAICVDSNGDDIVNEPEKDANDTEDGIYTIEDLGPPKEENQCGNSKVSDVEIGSSALARVESVQLVELVSVCELSKVDIIQCSSANANDGTNNDQNKVVGSDEKRGVKRPQEECRNKESSVRLVYSSLPSRSKRKLEELIRHWSDWHAQNCASAGDPAGSLESGEETYYPALHVGSEKSSTVSYSMDVHVSKRQRKESSSLNNEYSPLYERGYAIGLASDLGANEESCVDLREAPRCFNCGSFNHPLSGCPKPLDRAAVNSARKEFQSKKNQNSGPRVPTRYYQDSPGGKFDGLRPGALSKETRTLLSLGELDPPPWLNRMRELGYPPGYLHLEEKDEPSGITIYGGDEIENGDMRNGHTSPTQKAQKKMMIHFPGINAPIPENADQTLWAESRAPVISDCFQNRPDNRSSYPPNSLNNGNFHGAYGLRNHIGAPSSPYDLGSSTPVPPHPYNYHPSEPFSPRSIPLPGSPHYGRPYMHYNYGTF